MKNRLIVLMQASSGSERKNKKYKITNIKSSYFFC